MARVRNNQGHRSKILNIFMRPYLEQEHTQEKEAFDQARETIKPLQDKTWQLAKNIVGRFYTPKDVEMAYHLQNKFPNVNTIAKDSCFHFGYMNKKDGDEENMSKKILVVNIMNKTTSTSQSILISDLMEILTVKKVVGKMILLMLIFVMS